MNVTRDQAEHERDRLGRWEPHVLLTWTADHFNSTLQAYHGQIFDFFFLFSLKSIFSCNVIFSHICISDAYIAQVLHGQLNSSMFYTVPLANNLRLLA